MQLMNGKEFRWIRINYGLTTTEVAQYLRVARRTVDLVETGELPFKQRYAVQLEQIIGAPMFKALRAEYERVHAQEQATEAEAKKRRLNTSQQEDSHEAV